MRGSMLSRELRELFRELGTLILRLGTAVPLLVLHGWPKWANYAQKAGGFPDPLGVGSEMALNLAIFGELVCAALLVVGLATRFAGVVVAGMFAVIVFVVQPGEMAGELAGLYGVAALAIASIGPGRLSLDALLGFVSED